EVIALAGFAGVGQTHRSTGSDTIVDGIWIGEDLRGTVHDVPMRFDCSGHYGTAFLLPVGSPAGSKDREGQPAGPASEAGEPPASDEPIYQLATGTKEALVGAEWQQDDPVAADKVTCIEAGYSEVELGFE